MADREQPTSRAVAGVFGPLRSALYQIRLDQQPPPSLAKRKCENDYLPSLAAVKYHSHLTTCPPRHPDEFIEKCGMVIMFWLVSVYIYGDLFPYFFVSPTIGFRRG
ncbi:hypothetical protein AVEN_130649-1 [Araneus ventricosus]|uniref:Uncharacterized protein n=1 Tax=Araneus ventricosus TaxID=182803 RepID=A0A4Y2WZ01_ARAVE|nr:hypothetical protein AVEN_111587-1 [Araneus ventricosus]GBO42489.1 hypothetical protein AVEN_130649-1 [Araneus ventricosus]